MTPDQVRQIIREELANFDATERYTIQKLMQFFDGRNIQLGKTAGTKIGTAATQKLSFHGVTPVIQASAIATPTAPGATYLQAEAASAKTAIDAIRVALTNKGITA